MKKETICVHRGTYRDPFTCGVNTPIFTSSAFDYRNREGSIYPRYFNTPNQNAVTAKLCALEGAEDGMVFSSGMAAISTTILAFAGAGDHVIMLDDLYGGTHAFATDEFQRLGIALTFVETDATAVRAALQANTKLVVIESPTNPLLNVIDIRAVSDFARKHDLVTVIDNTFASPINQNPIGLGIDIVAHSGTKYLGGHSDICCGFALTSKKKAERIRCVARHLGGSLDATVCYLLERSLKTLAIRVQRQTENALEIARFLESHSAVRKVNYPGLAGFAGHAIAKAQMHGFGAMLSFELDEARVEISTFLERLALIAPAVSLGGVDSTICVPAVTSHAKISAAERERVGITDSLLRLSVGIEDVQDLIDDIDTAIG
jgi:cystathionine beta-lyase/cystathionine gamma-synthase